MNGDEFEVEVERRIKRREDVAAASDEFASAFFQMCEANRTVRRAHERRGEAAQGFSVALTRLQELGIDPNDVIPPEQWTMETSR